MGGRAVHPLRREKDVNIDTQISTGRQRRHRSDGCAAGHGQKKDMINDYHSGLEAGLAPVVVDVERLRRQNMFSVSYDLPERDRRPHQRGRIGGEHQHHRQRRDPVFTVMSPSVATVHRRDQKQLNVSYEEAEALKIGGNRADADAVSSGGERVLSSVAEQVAGEIQRSLDFYAGTAADSNFTKVYLSVAWRRFPRPVQDH